MTASPPRFTVLMSVGRFPELLPHAVACVLAQTEQDLELVLLCDPHDADAARRCQALSAADARVVLSDDDRAAAIESVRGTLVATTTDETLWFPSHLAAIAELLAEVEYGHLLRTELDPDGSASVNQGGPTGDSAFRVEAYRRLNGAPGPAAGTRFALESITLVSAYRNGPAAARAEEAEAVYLLVSDACGRRDLRSRALASWHADLVAAQSTVDGSAAQIQELYRSRGELSAQLAELYQSRGELSAQLAEYANSRAAYAHEKADLHLQVARLTRRNLRLTERLRVIEMSRSWRLLRWVTRTRAAVRRRLRRR